MQTVTRQQFTEGIEAGIAAVESSGCVHNLDFPALRTVAATAEVSAVGSYNVWTEDEDGSSVGCPISQAHPGGYAMLCGDIGFVGEFDRIMLAILESGDSQPIRIEG